MEGSVYQAIGDLHGIDYVIVIMYMVGVFALGSFFGKYVKDAGDFFVASRALPFWAIGMSIVVSDIGAMDFVAVAGSAYSHGIAVANFDWMGSMPAMVFAAFIFVPFYWRSKVYTIPEFLGRRYNAAVQMVHAGIWGIFLLTMLALMLWVTGDQLMHTILGWKPSTTVWLMVLITGVYTFAGGLSAVVMVDVVQLIIMFIGGLSLLWLSMWEVGGWEELKQKVWDKPPEAIVQYAPSEEVDDAKVRDAIANAGFTVTSVAHVPPVGELANPNRYLVQLESIVTPATDAEKVSAIRVNAKEAILQGLLDSAEEKNGVQVEQLRTYESHFKILLPHNTDRPYPWTGILLGLGIVLSVAYMSGNQAIVQRTLGARSEWDAKGGMLFGGFLKSFIPLMVALPGLCAIVLAPGLADGDRAVPTMISLLMPPGLKGLMFVALFAALMSSVDSTLNSASTIWTTDLYGRMYQFYTGHRLSERHALNMGRAFTFAFIVLAGFFAKYLAQQESLYVFIQTALSLFQGPTLAILLVGIVWRRANRWGGLAGLVLGVTFTTVLNSVDGVFPSDDPFLFIAWWSFVFSSVVTIVVSLVTPPEPEEKIRGLVWSQVMHDEEVQQVFTARTSD